MGFSYSISPCAPLLLITRYAATLPLGFAAVLGVVFAAVYIAICLGYGTVNDLSSTAQAESTEAIVMDSGTQVTSATTPETSDEQQTQSSSEKRGKRTKSSAATEQT